MNEFPMEPDRSLIMPETFEFGFTIFATVGLIVAIVIGIRDISTKRDPLMLYLLIGGFLGEMLEPICNVLGMAFHPEIGQEVGFTTLGREIPLWLMLTYPWYFAVFGYRIIRWDQSGQLDSGRYWKLFWSAALFCFAIEIWPVQIVFWDYYGPQPLTFFGMPLMWYVVNPTSVVCAGAFAALIARRSSGFGNWPLMVTMPICIVGFHTGVFAPLYMTQNAGWTATESLLIVPVTCFFAAVILNLFKYLLLETQPVGKST